MPQHEAHPPFSRSMKWTFTPSIDREKGLVMLDTEDWGGKITREVMNTKERAIRRALIALGWIPPPGERTESPRDTREDCELCQH
jgi:hypothetical protein